jgi:hypothetical protein
MNHACLPAGSKNFQSSAPVPRESVTVPPFQSLPARLLGAIDIFVLWWMVLVALGLSILYQARTLSIARWLFGAYAGGAAALALTQALRGGL